MEGDSQGLKQSRPYEQNSQRELVITGKHKGGGELGTLSQRALLESKSHELSGEEIISHEPHLRHSKEDERKIVPSFSSHLPKWHKTNENYIELSQPDQNASSTALEQSGVRASFLARCNYPQEETILKDDYLGSKFLKPPQKFLTGSNYFGEHNLLGFAGEGIYRFPHGVTFEGTFNESAEFDGPGKLIYPRGHTVIGNWKNGILQPGATVAFGNGEIMDADQAYCKMPDRRFKVEIEECLESAGNEYLTNWQPTRVIPEGCFDVGDGFYNPRTKFIMGYGTIYEDDNTILMGNQIIGIPTAKKERWIKDNCRRARDEPTGYRPDLYETWTYGKAERMPERDMKLETVPTATIYDKKLEPADNKKSRFFSFIYKPPQASIWGRSYGTRARKRIRN